MELIVVLIIIAVLMAALLPSLIGWINEARESALRVDGRSALLAVQSTVTEVRGLNRWNNGDPYNATNPVTNVRVASEPKFQNLMQDAGLYRSTNLAYNNTDTFVTTAGAIPAIRGIRLDADGNVVGLIIRNTIRQNRDVDGVISLPLVPAGIGNGFLLVGQPGASTAG